MGRTLRLETPEVFEPLLKPARYKGVYGGRGAGKSHFFAEALVEKCLIQTIRAVCIREIQKSLEQSVKRLIETPGGGIIIFIGMQNHTAESIQSLEGYDIAWVEEAQSLSARSLMLLRPTLRKDDSELWFTWNPRHKDDPVDVLFRGPVLPPNGVLIHATYRDNPYLPDILRTELEWDQRRDPEKYAHIWLGEYERKAEARVFRNWVVEEFETPARTPFLFGADWGFATDPSVLLRAYVVERKLYIDREAYRIGCEIDHTPLLFDTLRDDLADPREWEIVADSARPETISYMQRHGYPRIVPARKGPNSVEEGVEFLKSYDIVVHPRCTHVIDELTSYCYKTHPLTDEVIPILEDKKNHTIDATRYLVEKLRMKPVQQVEVW